MNKFSLNNILIIIIIIIMKINFSINNISI